MEVCRHVKSIYLYLACNSAAVRKFGSPTVILKPGLKAVTLPFQNIEVSRCGLTRELEGIGRVKDEEVSVILTR